MAWLCSACGGTDFYRHDSKRWCRRCGKQNVGGGQGFNASAQKIKGVKD